MVVYSYSLSPCIVTWCACNNKGIVTWAQGLSVHSQNHVLYLISIWSHFLQQYAHLFKLLYLLFAIGVATITHWQDYFCCLLLVN